MNVTEQIDAMQVSGTNPFKFLVVTRVLAATLMLPLLVVLADAFGLFGSFVGVNVHGHVSTYLFFSQVFQSLQFQEREHQCCSEYTRDNEELERVGA